MANVQMIIKLLTELAPESYAYDWDNVGMQVGSYNQNVNNILLSLDINEEILSEAIKKNCELIISHHPLIFNELNSIHDQTETGKIIMEAIRNNISIYSAHTNLDIAEGGLNDELAKILQLTDVKVLNVKEKESYYKLVIFGPKENLKEIRENVLKLGAGNIGNYSYTSFTSNGEGTFKPEENSQPYIGEKGNMTKVDEFRFETIVKENKLNKIINKIRKIHPYEEMAYDIYPLNKRLASVKAGLGRIGKLSNPLKFKEYITKIKKKLSLSFLRYYGDEEEMISKVAVCNGSGADLITAAKFNGADLYITGDVKYHEAQRAEEIDLNLIDAGHYGTENIVIEFLFNYLSNKAKKNNYSVNFFKSEINSNPWKYI